MGYPSNRGYPSGYWLPTISGRTDTGRSRPRYWSRRAVGAGARLDPRRGDKGEVSFVTDEPRRFPSRPLKERKRGPRSRDREQGPLVVTRIS